MVERRILFTGARSMRDPAIMEHAAWDYLGEPPSSNGLVFIHGGAEGADKLVDWLHATQFPFARVEVYKANFFQFGKKAGPLRNQKMVDLGAEVCLAFPAPKSVGTWDCIKRAVRAGIPTRVYPVK